MPNLDLSGSVVSLVPSVSFKWNGTIGAAYCRADEPMIVLGTLHQPCPTMELSCEKQHGGVLDAPWRLRLPASLAPFAAMVAGAHAPVTATIVETDMLDDAVSKILFVGIVAEVVSHLDGGADTITASIVGWKQRLAQIPLGIPALKNCSNSFGDKSCQFDVASISNAAATATVVDAPNATMTFAALTASGTSGRYQGGYVEREGLRLRIRKHLTTTQLWLDQSPPANWTTTGTYKVVPGCRKDVADCAAYANTARFNGIGRAMPAYDPRFEDAP